jgi:hypothetical protein
MSGCTDRSDNKKIGFVVTPSKNDIYYKCGNKEANLDSNGKFVCESFPILFYIDGREWGAINTIHGDGYVFPQDMEPVTIASR